MKIKRINALLIGILGLLSVFLLTPDVFAEEVTLPVLPNAPLHCLTPLKL